MRLPAGTSIRIRPRSASVSPGALVASPVKVVPALASTVSRMADDSGGKCTSAIPGMTVFSRPAMTTVSMTISGK